MKKDAPQLLILVSDPEILTRTIKCVSEFKIFSNILSLNTPMIPAIHLEDKPCETLIIADEHSAEIWKKQDPEPERRIGLLLYELNEYTCTLVGNVKPEYIIMAQNIEEDASTLKRAILRRHLFFSNPAMRKLLGNAFYKPLPSDYGLSDRSIEAFNAYLLHGEMAEAAKHLSIETCTLREHLTKIKHRLNMPNLFHVTFLFVVFGWVYPEVAKAILPKRPK
jgi:hypothetical protein